MATCPKCGRNTIVITSTKIYRCQNCKYEYTKK